MTARTLDGRAVSAQIRSEVSERVQALSERGVTPGLAAVLVGDDQASRIYVGAKHKACADVGIRSEQIDLPAYVTEGELLATLRRLNRDPDIHGIIVQLPMPARPARARGPANRRPREGRRRSPPVERGHDGSRRADVRARHALRHRRAAAPRGHRAAGRRGRASWGTGIWWARRCRSCCRRIRSAGTPPSPAPT